MRKQMRKLLLAMSVVSTVATAQVQEVPEILASQLPVYTESESIAKKAVSGFDSLLQSKYPDLYGGLYLSHFDSYPDKPNFKIILLVTDLSRAHEITKHYVAASPFIIDSLEIKEVKYSVNDLTVARVSAEDLLKIEGIKYDSAIYIMDNKIGISINEQYKSLGVLENKLKNNKTKKDMSEMFTIKYVEELSKPHIYPLPLGGNAFINQQFQKLCTIGFHRSNIFGPDQVYSAGHCDGKYYAGSANTEFFLDTVAYGGSNDWSTHHGKDMTISRTGILTCENGCLLEITGKAYRAQQLIGDRVCKFGSVTKYTCGDIISTTVKPDYIPNGFPTFVAVKAADGSDMSDGGDSGSPVFSGSTAYGILSGGNPQGVMVYMPLNAGTPIRVKN